MKKRIIVTIMALAMILSLSSLVACNNDDNQAKEKVEINVALYMLTNSLEPLSEDLVAANSIIYHVLDRLVEFIPDSIEWKPGVAKSWTPVDDRTMDFEINLDYKFSNGENLTMDDVVYSVMRLKEVPKTASVGDYIESVTYTGNTLRIRGTEADNTLMHKILSRAVIISKSYVEANGDDALYFNIMGTGPYKVTEFTPGVSCTIETWDGYPFAKPQIDIINYSLIFETTPRYIALETGQIQFTHNLTRREMAMADENPNLSTIDGGSYLIVWLLMNCENPPFDNVNVRRAMAYAFDRNGFCSLSGGRMMVETPLFIGASDFMRVSPNLPGFDLDEAKRLLEAEGYNASNPLSFTLTCNTESDPGLEMFQSALRTIGVDMTIDPVEFSVWLPTEGQGNFQMGYSPNPNIGNHPLTDIDRFDINRLGIRNAARYYNERAQEIIDQFRFIPQDDPRLKDLANELTDIVGQEVPYIPIFIMEENSAMDSRLSGVVLDNRIISFRNATFTG